MRQGYLIKLNKEEGLLHTGKKKKGGKVILLHLDKQGAGLLSQLNNEGGGQV